MHRLLQARDLLVRTETWYCFSAPFSVYYWLLKSTPLPFFQRLRGLNLIYLHPLMLLRIADPIGHFWWSTLAAYAAWFKSLKSRSKLMMRQLLIMMVNCPSWSSKRWILAIIFRIVSRNLSRNGSCFRNKWFFLSQCHCGSSEKTRLICWLNTYFGRLIVQFFGWHFLNKALCGIVYIGIRLGRGITFREYLVIVIEGINLLRVIFGVWVYSLRLRAYSSSVLLLWIWRHLLVFIHFWQV